MASKSNSKVIWYILFAFITIILCYLFAVVCFFYITPNNISLKLTFWPFLNDQQVGQVYEDAIVEVKYTVVDEENYNLQQTVSVFGVNVRKDGYIVAPFKDLRGISDETNIQIFANSGEVFSGKLLFGDMNYNLAILKCEKLDGKAISLPYVEICDVSRNEIIGQKIVAVDVVNQKIKSGKVVDQGWAEEMLTTVETNYVVDCVVDYCVSAEIEGLVDGIAFNRSGKLIGFYMHTTEEGQMFMPAYLADYIFSDVISAYKSGEEYSNSLVESLIGFDYFDVDYFLTEAAKNVEKSKFYFDGQFQDITPNISYFSRMGENSFYLFEDFMYDGNLVLEKDNVILNIDVNGATYEIQCHADLYDVLYTSNYGDVITISYHEIDSLGAETSRVTFEV